MLTAAKAAISHEPLKDRVSLICGDGAHLPLRANSIDAVLMTFTLELFDTPEIPTVLAECRRVLKPGGRLLVAGMSKSAEHGLVVGLFEWSHRHLPNFIDCRPVYVRRAIEKAKFKLEDAIEMHIWVPVEVVTATKPPANEGIASSRRKLHRSRDLASQ